MQLFRRKRGTEAVGHGGIIGELERLLRRARVLAVLVPILLFLGFGTGKLTNRALTVPGNRPVRDASDEDVSRLHLEAISRVMTSVLGKGEHAEEYATIYLDHVRPVEQVLVRRGMTAPNARRAAWPLVEQTYRRGLDIATVISVIHVESNFKPTATSSVGARGLMQVMPSWAGVWRDCGRNLYDIADNLCNGTSILAWYLRRNNGDFRRAMLGYNGCVHGTNTPDCHTYPDKVARVRNQILRELDDVRRREEVARGWRASRPITDPGSVVAP